MKFISFVVPSYNAEKFLDHVLPSLLVGDDDVEVIVVNDGSKDNTLLIANKYKEQYPNIINVIDKPNGGHGSTINAALEVASGIYFKCVDADDWLDKDALLKLIEKIKYHQSINTLPDLYITNFVYENIALNDQHVSSLAKYFPNDESVFGWDKVKVFKYGDYFMMHSMVYKLDVLKKSKLHLLEHTFYVDNIYVYEPLYYVKTLCYLNLDLYRYYVGRSDQSVSNKNLDKNYAHQFRVFEETMLHFSLDDLKKLEKNHFKDMIRSFVTIFGLTQYHIMIGDKKKKLKEYKALIKKFKEKNRDLYNYVTKRTAFFTYYYQPFFIKKLFVKIGYKIINKKTEWN